MDTEIGATKNNNGKNYVFIVNPAAGGYTAKEYIPFIKKRMDKECLGYSIQITQKPFDAIDIAKTAVEGGADVIIAVGGDGTIHETAEGLIGSSAALGFIPAGSGNDFLFSLYPAYKPKSPQQNVEVFLDIILHTEPMEIDAIKMGSFKFLNIGSVGLDAEIVSDSVYLKKTFRGMSYLAAAVKNFLTYKNRPMTIQYKGTPDGKNGKITGEIALVAAANGRRYGGMFLIAPKARLDSGFIELCVVRNIPRPKLLCLFPLVLAGKHENIKEMDFIRCKKAEVFFDGVCNVNLDGNIYRIKGSLTFEVIEKSVKVYGYQS